MHELETRCFIKLNISPWGVLVLLTGKKDRGKRFCIAYLELNRYIHELVPIPRINNMFDQLSGARLFSKPNLKSGCYQVKVKQSNIPKMIS